MPRTRDVALEKETELYIINELHIYIRYTLAFFCLKPLSSLGLHSQWLHPSPTPTLTPTPPTASYKPLKQQVHLHPECLLHVLQVTPQGLQLLILLPQQV